MCASSDLFVLLFFCCYFYCRVQLDVLPGDVIDDPTLQRDFDVTCPACNHNGAVFIRSQDGVKQSTLALIWVCLNRDCQVDEEGNRLPSYRWMGS